MNILDIPLVRRTRRNHAIEHATIHVLTGQFPKVSLAGRADSGGFYVYGPVDTEAVKLAADQAIERLRLEPELAVHPFCGTNLVVGGMVAGLASLVALATLPESRRPARAFDVLPRLMLAGTFATIASQQLGPKVQEHITTLPDTLGVKIKSVTRIDRGKHPMHRVEVMDESKE